MTCDETFDDDLELAHRLALVAGELALDYFRRGVGVTLKADGSAVSEADVEIERALRALLTRHRPDDAVLGEELGSSGSSSRRWLIDPIDGTSEFVVGRPEWGTHIALQQAGDVVLGVITRPVLGCVWWASRGRGAYRAGTGSQARPVRLQVSPATELRGSRVTAWADDRSATVVSLKENAVWVEPDLGAILRVAEGELEGVVDPSGKAWDHAPLVVLVEEAGGRFSDSHGGRRLDRGEGRFTNGHVHSQLEQVLR